MAAANIPLALKLTRLMFRTLGSMFPQRFGRIAYEMWFSTTRFKMPERERPALESAGIRHLQVFNIPITTYIWEPAGSFDRTVLFAHGWCGRGTQVHAYIQPLLDAGFRVISYDGAAHGQTPGNQSSILQHADVLLALQQEYGHFDGIITHSFGGMAMAFACRFGLSPGKAVCICPPETLDGILDNYVAFFTLPDSVKQALLDKMYTTHGNILKTLLNTAENAQHLELPGLIIHDHDDTETPWQGSERISVAWRDSKLMLTDGLKHHRILRDDAVVKASVDFLSAD